MRKLHLFRIALQVAKDDRDAIDTAEKFAKSLSISSVHLYGVISGERKSPRVMRAVDQFISRKTGKLARFLKAQAA